jgi:deoxyribodipyrimidine photolyase-related protein
MHLAVARRALFRATEGEPERGQRGAAAPADDFRRHSGTLNPLGMALNADGGLLATKPYISTGNYVKKMSNYCEGCRFDPGQRTGDAACPFTTLYWDFLTRHREVLANNHRMGPILRNLDRFGAEERAAIARQANEVRDRYAASPNCSSASLA